MTYADLLQLVGPSLVLSVTEGREEAPGKYVVSNVRNAIAATAALRPLADARPRGQGVWRLNGSTVVVNGQSALLVPDGGEPQAIDRPEAGGVVLDFRGTSWIDAERLRVALADALDPAWRSDQVRRLIALLAQWRWTRSDDAELVAGLLLATLVQSAWPWRPVVSVTGQSNSGKTSLLLFLEVLLGRLCIRSDQSSEAGIRQALANSAAPILLDEFEESPRRQRVLELFRTSSRGGRILRGTQDGEGQQFHLVHIPWTAAIESGRVSEPDRNRTIGLELRVPPPDSRLSLPASQEKEQLSVALLAVALRSLPPALDLVNALAAADVDGLGSRASENLAVPASILAAATGDDPVGVLRRIAGDRTGQPPAESNQELLLQTLMASRLPIPGELVTVARAIRDAHGNETFRAALEASGLAVVNDRPGPRGDGTTLFVAPALVRRVLLTGTPYQNMEIGELLRRLDGAQDGRRRLCGVRQRGYILPIPDDQDDGEPFDSVV